MNGTEKWRFQIQGGLAGRKTLTLEQNTDFWPEKQQEWFYGYVTPEDGVKGTLWSKKIDFYADVRPFAEPIDLMTQPGTPKPNPEQENLRRLRDAKKQAYIEQVQEKLAALRAQFPPPVTRAMEERGIACFGNDKLIVPMAEAFQIWGDASIEVADRCRKAAQVLGGMKDLFADVQLPEDLMRHDTKLCEGLCKLLAVAESVKATADRDQVETGADLAEMICALDQLTDWMIEGGERLWGSTRKMTEEEYDAYLEKRVDAEFSLLKPLPERLKLLEELWEDPLVDLEERAEYMKTAIKAVRDEGRKKPGVPCPHKESVEQHLTALAKCVNTLEQEGESEWQRRAAQEMYPTCQAWRADSEPDLPPLSLDEFAAGLRINALITKTTTDEAGAIHTSLEIVFVDKNDSFGGHWITAVVKDGILQSVDLEG